MDTTVIIAVILGIIFCVGGPIVGSLVTKASEKAQNEEINKNKSK